MDNIDPTSGEVSERRAPGMPPAIAKAIIAVKAQVRQIGVDEKNEHGGYKYVSVDRFYERIGPMMAAAGLALLINEAETEVKPGASGKPWLFAAYELTFMHESGAMSTLPMSRSISMPISGPQTYGAAQSYIEKQFLRQVFKIPTGEKDADETAQGEDAPASSRSVPRRQGAAVPSANADKARDGTKDLMAMIDRMSDPMSLTTFAEWPETKDLEEVLKVAIDDAARRETMSMLATRARKRREQLPGSLSPFGGAL